ncbi:hypothetical protein [Salinarchaeum laminariae]|uniref:hypothetical protein n=1 Tax=Salinarchaeum laminariae TaxID=869888 RepID=UPI0020C03607|nr:hypothetical protein [Salinarchaeum laminariae]
MNAPASRAEWSSIWRAIHRTLATPGMLPLAIVAAIVIATISTIARRLSFVASVLGGDLPIALQVEFLLLYLPVIGGLPEGLPDVAGLLLAVLAGVTVAVLVDETVTGDGSSAGSSRRDAGLVLGVLSVVVVGLGPALLAGLAGLTGATGLLSTLPLGGLECSLLGVPGMILAIFWIALEGEDAPPGPDSDDG